MRLSREIRQENELFGILHLCPWGRFDELTSAKTHFIDWKKKGKKKKRKEKHTAIFRSDSPRDACVCRALFLNGHHLSSQLDAGTRKRMSIPHQNWHSGWSIGGPTLGSRNCVQFCRKQASHPSSATRKGCLGGKWDVETAAKTPALWANARCRTIQGRRRSSRTTGAAQGWLIGGLLFRRRRLSGPQETYGQ